MNKNFCVLSNGAPIKGHNLKEVVSKIKNVFLKLRLEQTALKEILTVKNTVILSGITLESANKLKQVVESCGLSCFVKQIGENIADEHLKNAEESNIQSIIKSSGVKSLSYVAGDIDNFVNNNAVLVKTFIFFSILIFLYFYFQDYSIFFISVPLSKPVVLILILAMTIPLSLHLISIKLTFYRIFLQTFLNQKSKIYLFFSHGFIVKTVAVLVAFILSTKILVFFTLSKANSVEYFVVAVFLTYYYYYNISKTEDVGFQHSAIRDDVNKIIKLYTVPFFYACIIGMCVSVISILTVDAVDFVDSMNDAMEAAVNIVDSSKVSWPFRIIVRHSHAIEVLCQQWIDKVPVFGKPFYCLYVVASEGAGTFFAMALLILSISNRRK